jgi:uncharacterized protein YabN with tetrapyrrole methylase and pyrophosphatase domain
VSEQRLVTVVGAGLLPSAHLTLAGFRAACESRRVLSIMPPTWTEQLPEPLCSRVQTRWDLYVPGRRRRAVYEDYLAALLAEVAQHGSVAHLCSGSPMWYDSIVEGILDRESRGDYQVALFPGVGSVEAILVDLRFSIAPGITIIDAASIVAGVARISGSLPCLVTQPHVVTTAFVATAHVPTRGPLRRLQAALSEVYPASHSVAVVTGRGDGLRHQPSTTFPLSELSEIDGATLRGASIFVPALDGGEIDMAQTARASDPEAFAADYKITDS